MVNLWLIQRKYIILLKRVKIYIGYFNAVCKFCEIEDPKDIANVKALVSIDGWLLEVSRYSLHIDRKLSENKILQICGLYLF